MATYYVDSTVGGPGSGTIGDPWDDLASNVNSKGNGPHTFYLRGGVVAQVYTENEVDITVDDIVIEPYQAELVEFRGTGSYTFDWHGTDITINGKDQLDINKNHDNGTCIYVREGADDCFILNCIIRGARSVGAGGVRVRGHRLTIDGATIYDMFNANNLDCAGISHQKGEDLIVQNCTIYNCYGDGIILDDADPSGPFYIWDNIFYTTVGECSENGIDAKENNGGAVQSEILRNTFYGFRACTGTCGGSGDNNGEAISVHNSCDNVLVAWNIIYDCSCGINIDDNVSDITVQRNVIYELVDQVADPNAQAVSMVAIGVNGTDINIWNNTMEDLPEGSLWGHGAQVRIELQNNIFRNCGTVNGLVPATADYNCWSNCTDTIAGANDVNADPVFVNEAGNDYRLQVTSPCIDAGTNVGLPFFGAAPDMGAYEFQGVGDTVVHVVIVTLHAEDALAEEECRHII
jgi:hypothetical protein